MDSQVTQSEEYIAARSVLLDALQALEAHLDAIVLVGAQAVYLRAGTEQLGIAPYTTDGDLVLDPTRLDEEPDLEIVMRSGGFELHRNEDGSQEPGIWVKVRKIGSGEVEVPVDLIVPAAVAPAGGRRGAQLKGHSKRAARKIPGLEASLLDHDTMTIGAFSENDARSFEVKVAGPVALLLAKSFKLHERLENTARPDRVDEKDAGDAYRLMQTSDAADCARTAIQLMQDQQIGDSVQSGIQLLTDLFRAPASAGTEMAIRYYRGAVPEQRVRAICTGFVASFVHSLGEHE